jgi:hypothetical protein
MQFRIPDQKVPDQEVPDREVPDQEVPDHQFRIIASRSYDLYIQLTSKHGLHNILK